MVASSLDGLVHWADPRVAVAVVCAAPNVVEPTHCYQALVVCLTATVEESTAVVGGGITCTETITAPITWPDTTMSPHYTSLLFHHTIHCLLHLHLFLLLLLHLLLVALVKVESDDWLVLLPACKREALRDASMTDYLAPQTNQHASRCSRVGKITNILVFYIFNFKYYDVLEILQQSHYFKETAKLWMSHNI